MAQLFVDGFGEWTVLWVSNALLTFPKSLFGDGESTFLVHIVIVLNHRNSHCRSLNNFLFKKK